MSKQISIVAIIAASVVIMGLCNESVESKLIRSHSRFYDEPIGGGYDGGYPAPTGERAIITVRGARNPYDGSAPAKIAIEDQPFRGPYPRGVYDRLDSGYGRGPRGPMYPRPDFGYNSGYHGGYNGGYSGGYGPMYGAPNRIAVTGAFPYGYGPRFA